MSLIALLLAIPFFLLVKTLKSSSAFNYYAKFTIYCLAATFIPLLHLPYFMLRPRNVLNMLAPAFFLRYISAIIGLKFTRRGDVHMSKDQTCVIVSNHQTSLDFLGMFEVWPVFRKLTAIGRMLLLFTGPFGLGAYLCGLVFINKDSPDRGKAKMNQAMQELKDKNTKLWVFAEGYRNHSGSIDEFKKGAFHMAIQGQVPIVPVVFSSYKYFMNKKDKVFNSGEVIIEALPEIPTTGMTSQDVNTLMKQTRDAMIKKYDELNREIENKTRGI